MLDFAAIADLHAMKRRIDTHRGFAPVADGMAPGLAGLDLKLGPGGIREIEFVAQTLQLVWGGRDPGLRDPTTLGGLRRLARARLMPRRTAAGLTVAYRLLRRIEHRLQMVADRQTHLLPEKPEELAGFAAFFGCPSTQAFAELLEPQLARVRACYASVFGELPDMFGAGRPPPFDLTGPDLPEETASRLQLLGFRNIGGMVATLRGWHAGRLRALRSPRARELMDTLLPRLLEALGAQTDPDAAFNHFDAMLSRQPAGVGLLSMFQRNPALLALVSAVLGAAPSLADHLARVPSALEGLLTHRPDGLAPGSQAGQVLARRLRDATCLEDVVTITRQLVRAEEFHLCVAQMQGSLDVDAAGFARTALADAALQALLPAVLAEQERRFGRVRGGDIAVVALGKAGSREMMAGSDLDLMMLYTYPPSVTESSGPKRLPTSQWFIRAAHAFVAALTAPGPEGPLYDVDMRLRPSGNKGPAAVPLSGFVHYHQTEAWTWERMALTRARVVAGQAGIRRRAERAITASLAILTNPTKLLADAADMRGRLLRDLAPAGPWDVKLRPGGGMEVEFIAQALQLAHGVNPIRQNTEAALTHLAECGALGAAEAGMLVRADQLWRTIQSMLRISLGRRLDDPPQQALEALLHAVRSLPGQPVALDRDALIATLDDTARAVRAVFLHRIGPIA